MTNLKQKLQNPFALIGQGFIVGLLLFWTTAPGKSMAAMPAPISAAAVHASI
jgi:hypothetical protein